MDPLSMTASIIAILQLTTKLTGYINDVRQATTEQAKVAIEASNLYCLLTTLRFRVGAAGSDDPWFTQVKMLAMPNGPLDQFQDILERMVEQISLSRKRDQIKSALKWKFTKSEVEDALEQMERLKSLINCALTGDLFSLSQAIRDDVTILKEQTEVLHIRTDRLQSHLDQELLNKLSRWLGVPDPSTNFQAALEKRHRETGLWLVNGQHFHEWKTSASSLMWLYGNVGCGKTILSTASLQEVNKLKETQSDTVISYFYFDFNDIEKQSWKKAIRSLLFQLGTQQQNCLQILKKLYDNCGSGQRQPAEAEVQSSLKDAVACPGYKYIILDALDECTDRENFMTFIREVIHLKHEGLRIMITSRREKDIEEEIGSFADHDINIQSAIVNEDIRTYVHGRLDTDTKLKKWPERVKEEIITTLMEKADGMFRWVYCQLESIRQCVKPSALKHALSTLPSTLYETYDRILQGIESSGLRQDAVTVLRWLCFSYVPLNLSEITEVLAIEIGDGGGFDPDERLPDPADILVICSSLISCSGVDEEEASESRIRLAHFSVKEYLLSGQCLWASDFQAPNCHMVMAEGCLHYLLYLGEKSPLTRELVDKHPLSRYAAEYWWQHSHTTSCTLDPGVINLAEQLMMNKYTGLLPWLQLYNIDDKWEDSRLWLRAKELAHPLYYASLIGLLKVVEIIIHQTVDINATGGYYGNALQAASENGHEKVVQILLAAGADVNATGGYYGNALRAASKNGHEKVVQILLAAGADINATEEHFDTALQAASAKRHEKIIQLLLAAGADVNATGGYYGDALQVASAEGHEKVVQILLAAGADVNATGGYYGNALQAASRNGHEKVVQILLAAGADINATGGYYGNALQAASDYGHEKVVQLPLAAGADVNATGGFYSNALQVASAEGHEKVVQILLAAGADVNATGGHYGTALQAASASGHEKVVQILVDAGADVNSHEDGQFGNALQTASAKGHENVVQILRSAGAKDCLETS